LWDASALLTEKSLVGKVLHALIGYQSRPAGVQVLVYGLVLAGVLILSRLSLLKPIRRSAVVPGSAEQRRSSG
jgi:high-affinity Fe2+/Pb2+ permease